MRINFNTEFHSRVCVRDIYFGFITIAEKYSNPLLNSKERKVLILSFKLNNDNFLMIMQILI